MVNKIINDKKNKVMKHFFTLLFAVVVAFSGNAQTVGQEAADFTLTDLNDQSYTLSANRGKVILVFLVGYNCPLCLASAPSVKSELIDAFSSNSNFEALVIDVWNGNKSAVEGFRSNTGISATFLRNGSTVASGWGTTYDRLFVIDDEGKIAFKGTRAAQSDVSSAKAVIQSALDDLVTTSVEDFSDVEKNVLQQNYPNPVNGLTKIAFKIDEASDVNLAVFDLTGKQVAQLVHDRFSAGEHVVNFDSRGLTDGVYLYRIETPEFNATRRMVVK